MTTETVILVMQADNLKSEGIIGEHVQNGNLYCRACKQYYGFDGGISIMEMRRISDMFMKLHKKCRLDRLQPYPTKEPKGF